MAAPLVSDALWSLFSPLLPPRPPRPKGGRPPVEDRAAPTGILFVLKSGIPWEMLPQEMGCGCGMSCWHRPARGREQRAAGPAQVGGGAHPVLDRPLPPAGGPLRAARRRSPRLPRPRLRGDLLPLPPEVLLGGLRAGRVPSREWLESRGGVVSGSVP